MKYAVAAVGCVAAVAAVLPAADAALTENQVLVVYNSATPASEDVFNFYRGVRPGVIGFDLNDATLAAGNISYTDFESKVRNPIRGFLTANNLEQQIAAITLTKGLPHRILDTDNATVGDRPGDTITEFNNGDATFASVDSELTLLYQDLRTRPGAGEAGGSFDSYADNLILNPYYQSSASVNTFSRSNITAPKTFGTLNDGDGNQVGYTIADSPTSPSDGGDFYLVTRLDGDTVGQVTNAITRGLNPVYNTRTDRVILDENAAGELDGDDYADTAALLATNGYSAVTHETSNTFLIGASGSLVGAGPASPDTNTARVNGPVAVLATYGGAHSTASQNEYIFTYDEQLIAGSIFNSIESFNGRPFGTLMEFGDQGSLAEFVKAGGSFGVGNAWEPFAGTVADNEFLLDNYFYNNLSWAEAAYTSLRFLSWQQIVLGDPLSTATLIIPEPTTLALLACGLPVLLRRRRV